METEGPESERLAVYYCKTGDHAQAAWRFERAGDAYAAAGEYLKAASMYAQAHAEQRWARPAPPVNVSALVD